MPIALSQKLRHLATNIPLRWILTIPFVFPTIGTVVLVGYLSYQNGQLAMEDLGRQLVTETNARVAQELRTYLQTPPLINRLNVDAVAQGQLDLQDIPALESALFNRLQQFEQVSTVLFVSPEGRFRLAERLPEFYLGLTDPPQTQQLLIYQLNQQGDRQELVYTEKNLDVRRDRPWYKRAVTTGKPGWSSIAQYGTFEALALTTSQPVYDRATQRLLGVFAVHIRLDYLSEFLHGLDISQAGQVIILDQNGALIASSTQEQLYKITNPVKPRIQIRQLTIDESQNELTRSLGQYLRDRPEILKSLDQSQYLTFRHHNARQHVKVTPFQDPYGLKWQVVTVIPESHFLGAIQKNTRATAALCLLTLTAAIVLGLFAANKLTLRLSEIDRVSRALAAGNLDHRLPTDSSVYELNGLAQTFNQMADQLQSSFDRLKTALAASEEKFAIIFHSSPDPIALVAIPAGRCTEANESFLDLLGYSREELIGQRFLDLRVWGDPEERTHLRQTLQEQGRVRNLEVQLGTRAGHIKTGLLSAELIEINGAAYLLTVVRDISDRKAAERALQQSEAALLQAQRIAHIGSWEFDPVTQKITWSEELFRIFGRDPDQAEPTYAEVAGLLPVEDWSVVVAAIDRAVADGTPYEIEHQIYRPDGTVRDVISKCQVVFDQQQQVVKLYGTALDITDRKQAEAEIQQLNQQLTQRVNELQTLFDVLPIGVAIGEDPECQIARINPCLSEMLRVPLDGNASPSAPVGDRPAYRVFREGQELSAENLPMQYASAHNIEVRDEIVDIVHPDGTVVQLLSYASPLRDEQGNVRGSIGGFVDITDRKQAEIALQESKAQFQEIAQTINQVFYVISVPTGQYLYISPAYEKLWGYSCESLYQDSKSWLDRIHPEDLDLVLEVLSQLFAGKQKRFQYRIFAANGAIHWIESESLIVHDEQGNPLRIVGLADDITDRKQLEEVLRSQAEEERLLSTITQNIRQSLDLEQILATTVLEVQQTLRADRALIFRLHSDGAGQVIQEAVVPQYPVTEKMRWEDEHFPQDCYEYYRQGNLRIVPDVAVDKWASCLAEFLQEMGVKSKVVAPIVRTCGGASANVWGLLVVHACAEYRQWQQSEVNLLQQICNQLAIAIDQANLYQQLQTELAERKQAEEALQEREVLLRAIGDNLPQGFIYQLVHDSDKGFYFSYVSAGVERLFGIKPEVVMSDYNHLHNLTLEPDRTLCIQLTEESLQNLSVFEMQMRKRTAAGEIQWSTVRSVPRRLADGRTVWDGIEVDITNLKQVEEALRASEERFRRAFDDAPIGISLISLSGQFLRANTYYCDLLGYSQEELLKLTFQEITHPADLKTDLEGMRKMLAGEIRSYQVEKRYITKQGAVIPVLLNVAPIQSQPDQPLYFVGQIQDIRDRRKVEQMKDEFISVVSHELRTPLTSIQGALGILKSGIFDDRPEKADHMLHIAINNCERLERLVNDILTLERLESGKVQLVMEHCQVTDLLRQAVESVQAIADQAEITLTVNPLTTTIWAAPDAIVQTLTNLLSNAIKFSGAGDTVWLEARLEQQEAIRERHHSVRIFFSVKDQGRGIPVDKLDVIFEQFQQVDVSDSRKKGGTGLGLAICKTIVQQHGGQIWVESTLGQGSTFYVALPIGQTDERS